MKYLILLNIITNLLVIGLLFYNAYKRGQDNDKNKWSSIKG